MKKLFISSIIFFSLSVNSAYANVGFDYPQLKQWVTNHKFLSPWLEGFQSPSPTGMYLSAFRQLEDNWFLDIDMHLEGKSIVDANGLMHSSNEISDYIVRYQDVHLYKKEYTGKDSTDGNLRPWKNIGCKDIWQRDNQTALKLLSLSFSENLKNDFRDSKMIYSGPNAVVTSIGYGPYYEDPGKMSFEEAREWGMDGSTQTQIFVGKNYSYQRLIIKQTSGDDNSVEPHSSCPFLKIEPVQTGLRKANVLGHQKKLYKKWLNWQKQKSDRTSPANISIE